MLKRRFGLVLALTLLAFAPRGEAAEMRGDTLLMTGAGSTFINPLFSKWFSEYNKENPKVELNYQSIGSGGGIKQLQKKTIDFAASDVPMSDQEMADAGATVLHFPVAMGAVVLSYNLPMLKTELKLDSAAIAAIVRGQIKKWNDPKLQALNKGVALPDQAVVFVYRSDSSGTTGVFTDYLGKAEPTFATEVGVGKAIKWPTGLGGKGNEGVTANIKNTVGSIGYVELTYALNEKLPRATLKNKDGKFIKADLESVTEAAAQAIKSLPADFRGSLTLAAGPKSYPISAFTYLLAYPKTAAPAGKEIERVLTWAFDKGQSYSTTLGYAPLPKAFVATLKTKIKEVSGQ